MSITLNTDNNIIINTNSDVTINTAIEIVGTNTELPIKIVADFSEVPKHLHEVYLNCFNYQYNKYIKTYNNTSTEKAEIIPKKSFLNKIVSIFK